MSAFCFATAFGVVGEWRGGKLTVGCELLLVLEHLLGLGRTQVLEGVGIRATGARGHAGHHGGGVDLAAGGRHSQVSHLMLHLAARAALLALVVRHAGRHGVARHSGMLLHAPRVPGEARTNTGHHFGSGRRLSTAWMLTSDPLACLMRRLAP